MGDEDVSQEEVSQAEEERKAPLAPFAACAAAGGVSPCAAGEDENESNAVRERTGLPVQLHRLPLSRLNAVQEALAVLRRAGLTSVSEVETMHGQVGVCISKLLGLSTTYTSMCDWARSRTTWRAAVVATTKSAATTRPEGAEDAGAMPSATETDAKAEEEDLRKSLNRGRDAFKTRFLQWQGRAYTSEKLVKALDMFADFTEAQVGAAAALRALSTSSPPRCSGDGLRVLFSHGDATDPVFRPAGRIRRMLVPAAEAAEPKLPRATARGGCAAVVSLHVGGAGCGMGLSMWQRLGAEHGIGEEAVEDNGWPCSFFAEKEKGAFVPRAVLVDSDTGGYAAARNSRLFASESFAESCDLPEGAATCLEARGLVGWHSYRGLLGGAADALRRQLEAADRCGTVLMTHALSGDVGGILGGALLELAAKEVGPRKSKWTMSLMPHRGDDTCETSATWYNTVLACEALKEHSDATMLVDNAAMKDVATHLLRLKAPTHADFNALTARCLAAWSSPLRITPGLAASLRILPSEAVTNLTMYPSMKFHALALGPLYSEALCARGVPRCQNATSACLRASSILCSVDAKAPRAAVVVYARGSQHIEVVKAVLPFKRDRAFSFVSSAPTGFAIAAHASQALRQLPSGPETACIIAGPLMESAFQHIVDNFDEFFRSKQGIVGCYEERRLKEAAETLRALIRVYKEAGTEGAAGSENI